MRVSKKFEIFYPFLFCHCEGRSNPVNIRNFFLFFWIASFVAMTTTRHKEFLHHLRRISLAIPAWHTLYRISTEYMDTLCTIFFSGVEIDILRHHLTFPLSHKIVIDNHFPVPSFLRRQESILCFIYFISKNLEHPHTMIITDMVGLIITTS